MVVHAIIPVLRGKWGRKSGNSRLGWTAEWDPSQKNNMCVFIFIMSINSTNAYICGYRHTYIGDLGDKRSVFSDWTKLGKFSRPIDVYLWNVKDKWDFLCSSGVKRRVFTEEEAQSKAEVPGILELESKQYGPPDVFWGSLKGAHKSDWHITSDHQLAVPLWLQWLPLWKPSNDSSLENMLACPSWPAVCPFLCLVFLVEWHRNCCVVQVCIF